MSNRLMERRAAPYTAPIAPRLTTPPAVWVCAISTILCQHGHPLLTHKSGFHTNQSRIDGHVFHGCEHCKPTTFFFGDLRQSRSSDPIIYCHAITREQYDYWNNEGRDIELEGGTLEMLYRLGHNPHYRPPR